MILQIRMEEKFALYDPSFTLEESMLFKIRDALSEHLKIEENDMNQTETIEIKMATTAEQIQSCYLVMHQLRPHLTEKSAFIQQVQRQLKEGYYLAYIETNEEIQALAGFRILEFLAWGKVLYIDDLITNSEKRKNGHGGKLLKWIIERAQKENCDQVHLDSGPHRHDAHRLYLNHGFKIIGHHFALNFKKLEC